MLNGVAFFRASLRLANTANVCTDSFSLFSVAPLYVASSMILGEVVQVVGELNTHWYFASVGQDCIVDSWFGVCGISGGGDGGDGGGQS